MAPGTSGAEELPRVKHKWSENSKVYTRKINRNPKNINPNNRFIEKSQGETSNVTAVESNGGEPELVGNGSINVDSEKNNEKKQEGIVEEVPIVVNSGKGVPATADNNVERVVEEVLDRETVHESIKDVPSTTEKTVETNNESIVEEVPDMLVSEEVPDPQMDHESIKDVPSTIEKTVDTNRESILEEVPDMLLSENVIKEVPENGNRIEEVSNDANVTEELPNIDDIEEGRNCETSVQQVGPHSEYNIEEDVVAVPEKTFSPKLRIGEANSSQPQQSPFNGEAAKLSEGSSSQNRVEEAVPNGHDDHEGNFENGVVREDRPMVTQVDDRLNISVSAAKSREEVRDLKRKLEGELDQVRKMARKLEAKETQLSNVGFDGGMFHEAPSVGRLHFPVNGGSNNNGISNMRGNLEMGSVSFSHPRPFGELAVAVTSNSYHGAGEMSHEKEKRTPKANQFYRNSDFLLGKERLPPADSNRKAKSSGGGRRHGSGSGGGGGGGEFDTGLGFDKKFHKKCNELLQKLRNHKHGWVFNQPVDVNRLGLHDYFDIIKHPMDLGTVKTRLTNNWYKTPREFAEDVRLTFHNAMTYNPEGQDVHIMAKELLRIFQEKWPAIEADYDRRMRYEMFRDLGTPTPTSRKSSYGPIRMPLPPPPILHPPPFHDSRNLERSKSMPVRPEPRPKPTPPVRTPAPKKPKAKDPHKRDMTFDEKQKLSTNLQCLPSEKLDVIVQIIKKRSSALSQHDDEIEVDIDSVDTETLWELDRFVTNYKKSLSKHKRKAEIAMQARAAAAQAIPETVPPAPANVEPPREEKADEGTVATSPQVQQQRQSDNASDSSSSSSSSSSGSSSSDSDSSSSSDSGSDN
ncbi:hypothetical protein KSS87_001724 [Heliosperma pusillum]|nr:hypothetical protein KSS87_017779 [Heliosperma pusillum]KAH9622424.1 hypothetical protein KSS87_001724 [Heliosperma pusillum]